MTRILVIALRHLGQHALARIAQRSPELARVLPFDSMSGPVRFRTALEDLGGSFIKFGQMLALQPDVLTLEYCDALFDLLDRVPSFEYDAVERIFVEEFGKAPNEMFERFDRRPIASASIGQVHLAYLHGAKYAVKVQRPDARSAFMADIRLMNFCAGVIRRLRIRPLYWLLEPMEEFVAWTHEELDYRTEERYCDQLRRNADGNPWERIPASLSAVTSRRTLATEFLDGVTVLGHLRAITGSDEIARRCATPSGFVPTQFARHIIDNFLSDVFRHGLFHADLHPANLMILPDNVVGYIDFGITGVISEYSRENLVALTLAYTRGDIEGMADAFFNVCVIGSPDGPSRFRTELRTMAESWYERTDGCARLRKNFTLVMLDMLRLSHRAGVWPERDVIKYIRSAIAIDGLVTRFAPAFDVGAYLQHVCAQHLRWHARQKLLRSEHAVEWLGAAAQLIQTGPSRFEVILDRMKALDASVAGFAEPRCAAVTVYRYQVVLLAAVVLLLAGASTLQPVAADRSLEHAQLIIAGTAAARLCTLIWRLA